MKRNGYIKPQINTTSVDIIKNGAATPASAMIICTQKTNKDE